MESAASTTPRTPILLQRGIMEVDFMLASLLLVAIASLYLQFSSSNYSFSAQEKQVSSLELNALKASELLKRECRWNARECSSVLAKLNATVSLDGSASGNASNRVCVERLFVQQASFHYAEVCAS